MLITTDARTLRYGNLTGTWCRFLYFQNASDKLNIEALSSIPENEFIPMVLDMSTLEEQDDVTEALKALLASNVTANRRIIIMHRFKRVQPWMKPGAHYIHFTDNYSWTGIPTCEVIIALYNDNQVHDFTYVDKNTIIYVDFQDSFDDETVEKYLKKGYRLFSLPARSYVVARKSDKELPFGREQFDAPTAEELDPVDSAPKAKRRGRL